MAKERSRIICADFFTGGSRALVERRVHSARGVRRPWCTTFQRFRRGPDSPGSGLGLTLVAQQAALHRGRITVSDRPDGHAGTRFELHLPATDVRVVEHTLPLLHRDWLTGVPEQAPLGLFTKRS
jgi:hypothetical protein